jgi:hypothetical protein
MALDDRDYYREELARKRGVRPPAPFGQPIATRAKLRGSCIPGYDSTIPPRARMMAASRTGAGGATYGQEARVA